MNGTVIFKIKRGGDDMRQLTLFDIAGYELVVDNFAGGGGASLGIEMAINRPIDIAINHDAKAIALHKMNHPSTRHYNESVWTVDPVTITKGKKVGLAWFSPDCKHHSKARGGKPKDKKIRGLAWVAVKWAALVKPRVIMLENVEEFRTWGPLIKVEGKWYADPSRKGETFNHFIEALKENGYDVEYRELRACDYGAPTSRKRFFLIARSDGKPIVWPEPTHGDPNSKEVKNGMLKPWKVAADIIDWSLPCPSIFSRKKPLADNTLKRIAKGIRKFVIDNPKPYIVRIGQTGFGKDNLQYSLDVPLTTVTTKQEHCLITPVLKAYEDNNKQEYNDKIKYLSKYSSEDDGAHTNIDYMFGESIFGSRMSKLLNRQECPLDSIVKGQLLGIYNKLSPALNNTLSIAFIERSFKSSIGHAMDVPLGTITCVTKSRLVEAFLIKYYSSEVGQDINRPIHTITTKDRFGLIMIRNQAYKLVDIGLRMLQPRELFNGQGFPEDYIIERDYKGRKYPKKDQVERCGNAVPPPLARALVSANLQELFEGNNELEIKYA